MRQSEGKIENGDRKEIGKRSQELKESNRTRIELKPLSFGPL